MATPDVSILTPAFNASATLGATIDSVFGQSIPNWELIIADDGSTDSTAAIAQARARDPRCRMVSVSRGGASKARNIAAELALAPWLLFLDADDLILPDHLAIMLAESVRQPQPDLVYSNFARMTPDGRISPPEIPVSTDHFRHLCSYNPFFPAACLVRHEAFTALGGFDTTLTTAEDWDLWQRMARTGGIFTKVDRCLAHYRMRPASLSRRAELVFEDARTVILRGHARDARVPNPLPLYVEGMPTEGIGRALVGIAIWCAAMMIGNGQYPGAFLSQAQFNPTPELDIDHVVSMMQYGVPHGACVLQTDWPELWPVHSGWIRDAFLAIERRCGIPNAAADCFAELQRKIAI